MSHKWRKHNPEYKEAVGTRLRRMRRQVLTGLSEAQNHRCCYCGRDTWMDKRPHGMAKNQRATLEHLIPRSRNVQSNKLENLVMACRLCNTLRGQIDAMKFFKKLHSGKYENESKGRAYRRVNKCARKWERKKEKEPDKYNAKWVKTFQLLWIILHLWPEEGPKLVIVERSKKPEDFIAGRYRKFIYLHNEIKPDTMIENSKKKRRKRRRKKNGVALTDV